MSGGSSEQQLIDRRIERQRLRTLLGEAVDGTARFAGLIGDAGIGKSRLIGWLLEAIDPRRTTVLRCQATRDSTGPLDPIDQLLHQLRDDGHRIDDAGALAGVVVGLSERRPVVLVAEDIHWMEQPALHELEDIAIASERPARRGDPCHLFVLLTARPVGSGEPAGILLDRLLRPGPHGAVIELGPLDEVSSNELLRARLRHDWARRWRDDVFTASGGVPLLIEAAARQIQAADGQHFERRALADVQTAVDRQLASLDADERRILAVAATTGDPIDPGELATLAGRDESAVVDALDSAWAGGMLDGGGDRPFRFSHPLVAERSYDTLGPGERATMHARAAAWRRQRDPDPVSTAYHLIRAGDQADTDTILEITPTAARAAFDRAAWRRAAEFAERALETAPDDWPERTRLGLLAGVARFRNYDLDESEVLLRDAAAAAARTDDAESATEIREAQLRAHLSFSSTYESPDDVDEVLDDVRVSASVRSRFAEAMAELHSFTDLAVATRYADRALDLAHEAHDAGTLGRAHFARGLVAFEALELDRALDQFTASARHLEEDRDRWRGLWGLGRIPMVALQMGRLDLAESSARRAVHAADEIRAFGEGGLARAVGSAVALTRGQLEQARDLANEALDQVGRSDYVWPPRIAYPVISMSYAVEGRAAEAHAALDELEAGGTRVSRVRRQWVDWASSGGLADASYRPSRPPPRLASSTAGHLLLVADLTAAAADQDVVAQALTALEAQHGGDLVFPLEGLISRTRCLGALHAAAGRADLAQPVLTRAAHQADHARALPEAGRAHLALAAVLVTEGADTDSVTVHLESAGTRFEAAGMTPWSDRAEALLAKRTRRRSVARGPHEGRPCALMMTDIVGSTPLAVELGDQDWVWLLGRHDHLLRGAISDHGGAEFSHTGDGLAAWFGDAASALAAAADIQARLMTFNETYRPPLHVRIGLVWGVPALRHGLPGGLLAARVNRVMSCAGAHQIAADQAFVESLGRGNGDDRWVDRGALPLKGFDEPQQIWMIDLGVHLVDSA